MFGYGKGELEGSNVSVLMPPPFSQRHASYLQRYAGGGEPRILDSVREVIALHKVRCFGWLVHHWLGDCVRCCCCACACVRALL